MILIAGIIGLVTLGLFFATLFLVVKEKDENENTERRRNRRNG